MIDPIPLVPLSPGAPFILSAMPIRRHTLSAWRKGIRRRLQLPRPARAAEYHMQ
jgi:hypothetical protein